MSTAAERNLAAEVRAVEEGHHALCEAPRRFRVVSDTHRHKAYRVDATATRAGFPISFLCCPLPGALRAYEDDHQDLRAAPGTAGCKHAALVARRLERERRARLDEHGAWVATERFPFPPLDIPDDPFDGLV